MDKCPEKNLKLLDDSCKPCTQLIISSQQFEIVPFQFPKELPDADTHKLFKLLNPNEVVTLYDCVGAELDLGLLQHPRWSVFWMLQQS